MVQGEGVLDPVCCCVAGVPVSAGIVDQGIDAGEGEQLVREAPYLGLGGQVGDEGVHFSAACQTDRPGGFFRAFGVAADDCQLCPRRARPWTVALPMPPVAPVTTAVLPSMGLMFVRFMIVLVPPGADSWWCNC